MRQLRAPMRAHRMQPEFRLLRVRAHPELNRQGLHQFLPGGRQLRLGPAAVEDGESSELSPFFRRHTPSPTSIQEHARPNDACGREASSVPRAHHFDLTK